MSIRWAFNTANWFPTVQEWAECLSYIQPEEKLRIGKFRFKEDAKQALIGRLLMRKAVADVLEIPYSEIQLLRTDRNKPYLGNPNPKSQFKNFNFNVSHAGAYVVLAAETHQPCGVDVMDIRDNPRQSQSEFFRLMNRQFTPNEWKRILASPVETVQQHEFYRYWCLKESYIKATGIGLGLDLQTIEFCSDPSLNAQDWTHIATSTTFCIDGTPAPQWKFEQSYLDALHCVAVAKHMTQTWEEAGPPALFKLLSVEALLNTAEPLRAYETGLQDAIDFMAKPEKTKAPSPTTTTPQ